VWEANHVWLIFVLVFLWTGFPAAFTLVMTRLALPFSLVGLGIIFRGGSFVFRRSSPTRDQARLHGVVFAVASVVTPFFLGAIAGAIADGRLLDPNPTHAWTGPVSLVGGVLAVLACSFLAASLLAADAARAGDHELAVAFGRRALLAGAISTIVAAAAALAIQSSATVLAQGLRGRAAPLVAVATLAGAVALWDLRAQRWARARLGAGVAIVAIVLGWGVAQYPEVIVHVGTIHSMAGAPATMTALVVTAGIAALTVGPSLVWLYVLVEQPEWARRNR
jgi:cytochrome d ubiquinol oxidase subunit II